MLTIHFTVNDNGETIQVQCDAKTTNPTLRELAFAQSFDKHSRVAMQKAMEECGAGQVKAFIETPVNNSPIQGN